MRAPVPGLVLLATAVLAAPVAAQTLEERAAQVRQTLDAPLPVETVIDRGTRVIGSPAQPAGASAIGNPAPPTAPSTRVLAPADLAERLNRQAASTESGTRAEPAGQAAPMFSGVQYFPVWVKGAPPAFPAISRPNGGRVTGTSNLVTGSGSAP